MSIRVSLRSMIRVDTLRRVHNVGFSRGTAQLYSFHRCLLCFGYASKERTDVCIVLIMIYVTG